MKENDSPQMAARLLLVAGPSRALCQPGRVDSSSTRPVSAAEMTKNEIQFVRRGRKSGEGSRRRQGEGGRGEKARRSEDRRSEEGG